MVKPILLRRSVLVPVAFFLAFLVLGLAVSGDYGIAWDEPSQINIGAMTYRFVFRGDPELLTHDDSYHGLWYETLLVRLQYNDDPRALYLARHRVNFLCFYLGVVFFFLTARLLFRDWKAGLLAAFFLVLSPRIFADSFYNSKDVPFLAFFSANMFSLLVFLRRQNGFSTVLHALLTAALVSTRMVGLIVAVFTAAGLLVQAVERARGGRAGPIHWRGALDRLAPLAGWGALYGGLTLAGVVALWPTLWHNPLGEFINALKEAGSFPWGGSVLYLGTYIPASDLPWHYLPVWIGMTTPPLYLLGLLLGTPGAVKTLFAPGDRPVLQRDGAVLALAWCYLPLAMVIGLRTVVYDGWRHLFFIYPGLILLAVAGLVTLGRFLFSRGRRLGLAAAVVGLVLLLQTALFMTRYHPTQNLYFNLFAAPEIRLSVPDLLQGLPDMQMVKQRFETDYWGLTYRPVLDLLLRRDPSPSLSIYPAQYVGRHAYLVLPESERRRLRYEGDESATYYITNYREHPQDYPFPDEVFSYWVGNAKMATVFKLR